MWAVSTSDESERRVAEALRARASGAGSPAMAGFGTPRPLPRQAPQSGMRLRTALLIALLGGVVLGCVLALLSLLVPGALPAIG